MANRFTCCVQIIEEDLRCLRHLASEAAEQVGKQGRAVAFWDLLLHRLLQHDIAQQGGSLQLQLRCWNIAHAISGDSVYSPVLYMRLQISLFNAMQLIISSFVVQNLISVVILLILELFRVISTEELTWKLIKVWIPVNLIFIGMLLTGMYRYFLHNSAYSTCYM